MSFKRESSYDIPSSIITIAFLNYLHVCKDDGHKYKPATLDSTYHDMILIQQPEPLYAMT